MEGKGNKLILMLLMLLASARTMADNRSEIYSAYINNRMEQWKNVVERMEAAENKTNEFILELINYEYGLTGYYIGFGREKEAEKYLELAEKNTAFLEQKNYRTAILHAYRAAFYGYRISFNRLSVMVNGQKSMNFAKKSVSLDSENYLGYIQLGNAYFYTPKTFGGSKQLALDYFNRARRIMEKDPELTRENWNYLSLLVTLAQSESYVNGPEKAKAAYEGILKIEPGFLYVKNELYPRILEKLKTSR